MRPALAVLRAVSYSRAMPFTPFPPERPDGKRRRFRLIPVRMLLPNLITLLALCAGLTAIRLAVEQKLEWAVAAIVFAALLDGIDGRIARMLKGTSRFGAELDSLSDFVCFGVAPALILYGFILQSLKGLGWVAALLFAIASALRLARFNVMIDDPTRPDWKKNFFVGMAAPAGAVTVLLPIYLHFVGVPMGSRMAPVVLVYVLFVAFMMVSTVPTFSGKTMGKRVPRDWVLPIFVVTAAFIGLLVSFPFATLALGTLVYLGSIPFGVARYRQLDRAEAEALRTEPIAAPMEPPPSA
jgi:CDP-diacylglycerol---serine O-phosphatidyltransferase